MHTVLSKVRDSILPAGIALNLLPVAVGLSPFPDFVTRAFTLPGAFVWVWITIVSCVMVVLGVCLRGRYNATSVALEYPSLIVAAVGVLVYALIVVREMVIAAMPGGWLAVALVIVTQLLLVGLSGYLIFSWAVLHKAIGQAKKKDRVLETSK